MLSSKRIIQLFHHLNTHLAKAEIKGELGLVGGAAMCLAFNARASTKDVGAIFEPSSAIRKIAKEIAADEGLPSDWLHDAVKGFLEKDFERINLLELSHLNVWTPEPRYMLAMKCISARWDTSDRDDVIFLIKHQKLSKAKEVLQIIESYYPKDRIPPKTKLFIEEILGDS